MLRLDELLSLPVFSDPPVTLTAVALAAGAFTFPTEWCAARVYYRKFERTGSASLMKIPLQVLSRTALVRIISEVVDGAVDTRFDRSRVEEHGAASFGFETVHSRDYSRRLTSACIGNAVGSASSSRKRRARRSSRRLRCRKPPKSPRDSRVGQAADRWRPIPPLMITSAARHLRKKVH
jgi:hypothetical protein